MYIDYFLFIYRCKLNFTNNHMAIEYYNMAGIKLGQVLSRHAKRDQEENLVRKFLFIYILSDIEFVTIAFSNRYSIILLGELI